MSEPVKKITPAPESYSPKNKPEILNMMEKMNRMETFVEAVNDLCSIVDRSKMNLVGIKVPVSFESQGYPLSVDLTAKP